METNLNMNDNIIYNVKKAVNNDQAVNKGQMDSELVKKLNSIDAYQRIVLKDQPAVNANLDMNISFHQKCEKS